MVVPLYLPVGERRQGRISSTTLDPGASTPSKVVVDVGSTPEGPDHGPDVEIATRLWQRDTAPGQRDVRGLCGERDLMERRMRDPLSAQSFSLPEDAAWSEETMTLDDLPHSATVLTTRQSWVAVVVLAEGFLVRVFVPAPGPGPRELRRVAAAQELEPVRGRG
ncbi:hypothetical protein [Haloactinospora alba]|nr:hypothetical protein [Haloactinospora alba]